MCCSIIHKHTGQCSIYNLKVIAHTSKTGNLSETCSCPSTREVRLGAQTNYASSKFRMKETWNSMTSNLYTDAS